MTSQASERNQQTNSSDKNEEDNTLGTEVKNFYILSENFEKIKKYLRSTNNFYISYIFSLLGYHYKGKVEETNVFHLSAQAWLLGAFQELQKEIQEKSLKYNEILSQINQIIVEENTFIDNMRLLVGTFNLSDKELFTEDNRFFRLLLVNIQATKNEQLKENKCLKDENLTREKFDEILMNIFRTAFNITLNEHNSKESDKESLFLLESLEELKRKGELTLENYVDNYLKQKDIKNEDVKQIRFSLEQFYYFAICSFGDLLDEITLFDKNSGSVIFKIKNLISLNNLKRLSTRYYELLTGVLENGFKNVRLEGLLNYYKAMYNFTREKAENSIAVMKETTEKSIVRAKANYAQLKDWVNKSVINDAREYSFKIYESTMKYTEKPRHFVYETIYIPTKDLTIRITNTSIHFVVDIMAYSKQRVEALRKSVTETVEKLYENIKKDYFGDEPLVKIEYDNKDYLTVEINKKLMPIDPQKATELVKELIKKISEFSIIESGRNVLEYTKERVNKVKNYAYESYRKFLELANEDEEFNGDEKTDKKEKDTKDTDAGKNKDKTE